MSLNPSLRFSKQGKNSANEDKGWNLGGTARVQKGPPESKNCNLISDAMTLGDGPRDRFGL